MKKILLTLALALFAFAGVYAQETETETQTDDPIDQQMDDMEEAAPEEGMLEREADALQGKTKVTFEELPIAVQDAVTAAGIEETQVVEAYEIEASATGDAQLEGEQAGEAAKTKYEVHVNKDNKTKVMTFDESGEKIKAKKDKKEKW